MSENKSCHDYIRPHATEHVNCFTCRWWHRQDFVCLNPDEMAKRRKENECDYADRMMRENKGVFLE